MSIEDDKYFEQMMTLTGTPEWKVLVTELERMIYQSQANAFEAESWEKLQVEKGFSKGLMFIVSLRELLRKTREIENADI